MKNQYEAMFLFDPTFAGEFVKARDEIQRIFERAEAEVTFLERWEERKLAYEIEGRKRGCYILTYFKCDGTRITGIERDAQLSEPILRLLVKRADGITRDQIERFMPHARAAEPDENHRREHRGAPPSTPAPAKPDAPATETVATAPAESAPAESAPAETPKPEAAPMDATEAKDAERVEN